MLPGCQIFGANNGSVISSVRSSSLRLTNGTGAPIYHFVIGSRMLPRILWKQSVGPHNEILPGESVEFPFENILMDKGEQNVAVTWWHAVQKDDMLVPGERHNFQVKIR